MKHLWFVVLFFCLILGCSGNLSNDLFLKPDGITTYDIAQEFSEITGVLISAHLYKTDLIELKKRIHYPNSNFNRCALVGTALTTMIKNSTAEIDSHDAVVRWIQSPPSRIYPRSVGGANRNCSHVCYKGMFGSKMSYVLADGLILKDLMSSRVKHILLEQNPIVIYQVEDEESVEILLTFIREYPDSKVVLPTYLLWKKYLQIFEKTSDDYLVFNGIAFSRLFCDAQVNMYDLFVPQSNYDYVSNGDCSEQDPNVVFPPLSELFSNYNNSNNNERLESLVITKPPQPQEVESVVIIEEEESEEGEEQYKRKKRKRSLTTTEDDEKVTSQQSFKFCLNPRYWVWLSSVTREDTRFSFPYELDLVENLFQTWHQISDDYEPVIPYADLSTKVAKDVNAISCSRCAVIGGAPFLKGRGEEIDNEHDCWFRMNDHIPTEEEWENIGSKTTMLVINGESRPNLVRLFNNSRLNDVSTLYYALPNLSNPEEIVHVLYRDAFYVSTGEFFKNIKNNNGWGLTWYDTTGFKAISLALRLCSNVDVYGFGHGANSLMQHNFLGELTYYLMIQHYYPQLFLIRDLPQPIRKLGKGVLYYNLPWLIV